MYNGLRGDCSPTLFRLMETWGVEWVTRGNTVGAGHVPARFAQGANGTDISPSGPTLSADAETDGHMTRSNGVTTITAPYPIL